jgi:hypothetical protein
LPRGRRIAASSSEEDGVEEVDDVGLEADFVSFSTAVVASVLGRGADSSSELVSTVASNALILERGVSGVPGGEEVLAVGEGDLEEAIAV